MEKIYRIFGAFVLILLLTAIGVLAVNNAGLKRELADLRSDYSELAERNRSLEERINYYNGLTHYIESEVEQLDKRFNESIISAGSGLSGLQAQVDALRSWGAGHKQLEQAIIERLTPSAGN